MKRLVVLAGPNGAGKTTFATTLGVLDGIAREDVLNPDNFTEPIKAAHPNASEDGVRAAFYEEMGAQRAKRFAEGRSYALETNFTHPDKLELIETAKANGYETVVVFVALASPELAIKRVATRVSRGGHHIEDDKVRKRWSGGLLTLNACIEKADHVFVLDNSIEFEEGSQPIAKGAIFTFAHGELDLVGNLIPLYLLRWIIQMRPGVLDVYLKNLGALSKLAESAG